MLAPILKLRNDFLKNIDYTDEFLQRRKERQKRARKRRLIAWFIFLIILLLIVGAVLSLTVFFPIKKLTFTGSKIYTPQQIKVASDIDLGDNLFYISKNDILNKLKKKLPFIEDIKIERILPDTLKVSVTDAKRHTCYQVKENFYTVSKDGWVLEKTLEKSEDLILVIADNIVCKVGNAVEFKEEKSKQQIDNLIELLNTYNLSIDYINATEYINLTAGVEGRFEVIFGSDAALEYKVKYLNTAIAELENSIKGTFDLSMLNEQKQQGIFRQNNTN